MSPTLLDTTIEVLTYCVLPVLAACAVVSYATRKRAR